MDDYLKNTFQKLRDEMYESTDNPNFDVKGITDKEISLIEQRLGFEMPQVYRDFLSVFGHPDNTKTSGFWRHFCVYPDIISMADEVIELTKEEIGLEVTFPPNTLFVKRDLDDWSGIVYCDGQPDPLVYCYDYDTGETTATHYDYLKREFFSTPVTLSVSLLQMLKSHLRGIKLTVRKRPLEKLNPVIGTPPMLSESELNQVLTDIGNDLSAYDGDWFIVDGLLKHARTTSVLSLNAVKFRDILSTIDFDEKDFHLTFSSEKNFNYELYRQIMADYSKKHVIQDEKAIAFFQKMNVDMQLNK